LLYWPEFEFIFRLDVPALLPHVAAIEAYQEAASSRVLPPPWQEQPASHVGQGFQSGLLTEQPSALNQVEIRKQQLLMSNSGQAWAWVKQRFVPGSPPLSLNDILTMHRMASEEAGAGGGAFRTSGVQVGRREAEGIHLGAPVESLPRLMNQYAQFVNSGDVSGLPAPIHALVAHFFFTAIHPFDDGNGRVSRLVSAAILFQRGYNGHGFYATQNHFYQNALKYHTLLQRCWKQQLPFDLTAFVAFGMEGLVTELQGINSFIKMKLHRSVERDRLRTL
jgi:Fic family protein